MTILPQIDKVSYDSLKDYELIAPLVQYEMMLVGKASSKVRSISDLVEAARANPGKLNYGSAGTGTMPHLALEYLKTNAKIDLVHVPYKGDAPVLNALMGDQVDVALIAIQTALPAVKAGRIQAIGTSGATRFPLTPDIPTIAESGIPQFEAYSWSVLLAPRGTSPAIVSKLNAAVNEALKSPKVRQTLVDQGITPTGGTTAFTSEFVRTEAQKWQRTISAGKVTANR